MGLTPDLLEDLPSWHREKADKELKQKEVIKNRNFDGDDFDSDSDPDGFNDDYKNPSFVIPTSAQVLGQGK